MRDFDIRRELRADILGSHLEDPETVVVDELGLLRGSTRVDVAVINGELHGYEIKSAEDTLARLAGQAKAYSQVFDRVTLVASERHVAHALELVPSWWGILVASPDRERVRLAELRDGHRNGDIRPRAVAEFLWKDEALAMLATRGAARGYGGRARGVVWDRICEVYTLDEIRSEVRARLKQRRPTLRAAPS